MKAGVLLAFVLAGAPVHDTVSPVPGLLDKLRSLDTIDGCAVGYAGEPGRFFLVARDILKNASLEDYRKMVADPHSVVRVMGGIGIALQHPEAIDTTTPLLKDASPVAWNPLGCDVEQQTVAGVLRIVRRDASVLGLTSTGDVGRPCKSAGRPTRR